MGQGRGDLKEGCEGSRTLTPWILRGSAGRSRRVPGGWRWSRATPHCRRDRNTEHPHRGDNQRHLNGPSLAPKPGARDPLSDLCPLTPGVMLDPALLTDLSDPDPAPRSICHPGTCHREDGDHRSLPPRGPWWQCCDAQAPCHLRGLITWASADGFIISVKCDVVFSFGASTCNLKRERVTENIYSRANICCIR